MINETYEQIQQRKYNNIDEVSNLIHTNEWEVDLSEYDEKDGYIFITIFKKKEN